MSSPSRQAGPISRILQPIRGRLIAAAVLAGAGSMLTLVPLAGIAQIAHIALNPALARGDVWQIIIASVACLFAGMALISLGELAAHLADNRLTHQLRLQAMQRLGQVPLGWFTSRASGEVKQAMQDDINTLHSLTAHFYTTTGRAVGAIAISIIYLFAMDWRLALIAILPFPGFFLFFGRAMKASGGNMEQFVAGMGRINNAVVEFVNGIPVVKAFGATGRAHGSYRGAVDAFAAAFAAFTRPLVGSMANANALIAPVAVLGVVVIAGTAFVALEAMAPVDILPFALVAPGISAPMLLLHYLTHDLNNATGAAQRVQALLDTPVLAQPAPDEQQLPDGTEIRLEGVAYAYDGHNKVLSDITLTLRPGTVTAIVGASGSGKSTLARLLLRFFDPAEGRITLGGVDLRYIATPELYRRIGFVLQEVRLIHASVRENIGLGRPSASLQEIEAAARLANIHERLLALPRGYDSVLGEDAQLSGGELQRVSIARAVLLDPPVLVLDEATAAADAENEVAIQDALSRFAQGRTLLVIAHRLDTVMHADNIVVVENGVIVEQGSHAGLLAHQGRYAQLWALGGYQDTSKETLLPC
ncbi:ABC transporter ATP-binding protein [Janthinobacterium lividum]|uniref:ABC transporter ATP-binding protein n=1 Tax=Janthinobacterium lividum TaxID=29581 RepID=UPI000874FE0E|nr:ABC transporter ATP-binding protein [Janthinobacterium lividum]MCC7715590.1 ABC transporter ATP-binding protein [Janthinobacterium lividum]OEZ52170.1 iron import ATP-binding/permease protein IrtA [Janthinobacterium lividum]WQE29506.1 ABC transporter ATP-binding protein [Janthinobacterium lividum]STQ94986.1 Iron import ATP-binding/permease protein IrtA [Janthinobacterium lividum]